MLSNQNDLEHLVRYDTSVHEALAAEHLFCFSKIHIATKGIFTCPMKCFYVLCHNQPIEGLGHHPLIQLLRQIPATKEYLASMPQQKHSLIPKTF